MPTYTTKLKKLEVKAEGRDAERILAQLGFADQLACLNSGRYERWIENAVDYLLQAIETDGAITAAAVAQAEAMLAPIGPEAKSYRVLCTAHAHIDMNWMWGYEETVSVTLDTFRTMLNMMKEYPTFTFSQSQASVYRIVEEYDPEMLAEIKQRVKEGRWELTASTWVETDKNMPNGESLSRHILYTKKYLAELFDIDPDSLNIDFEPDTFGHNLNVPEILNAGGVKYYYHCRGFDEQVHYRWRSPSGAEIIVYREPAWYNASIDEDMALAVPKLCAPLGMKTALKVYGVGDHGGGPTRRDIEKLLAMNAYPVFPTIAFGTFAQFFTELEHAADRLPVVDRELNFVFTGCYTSQSRIKLANRISEAKMFETEAIAAAAATAGKLVYPGAAFEDAWRKLLFNHFHDILPGSGVIETREYAMGQFQQLLACANNGISRAVRAIAADIDTASIADAVPAEDDTVSEGGGAGYTVNDYGVSLPERGRGKTRVLHFFNPCLHERHEPAAVTVFDWPGDRARLIIRGADGNTLPYQIVEGDANHHYWGHQIIKLLIDVRVPALGYTTCVLSEAELSEMPLPFTRDPRVDAQKHYVLENECLRAEFNAQNAAVISLTDKRSGAQLIRKDKPSCFFRLIEEDDAEGMTSWRVGRYMNITPLTRDVKITKVVTGDKLLRQSLRYSVAFGASRLDVTVSLNNDAARLDYAVECDWRETARKGTGIPQLNFCMPLGYACDRYRYDIPFGTIDREPMDSDVPANSWALALPAEGDGALMVATRTKYGFRGTDDTLAVSLIRSSYDPDPLPEVAIHRFSFAVSAVPAAAPSASIIREVQNGNHPLLPLSGTVHAGTLPTAAGFAAQDGNEVLVSAYKLAEDGSGDALLRVYECDGKRAEASFTFARAIRHAAFADINERPVGTSAVIKADGNTLCFEVGAYASATVRIKFA